MQPRAGGAELIGKKELGGLWPLFGQLRQNSNSRARGLGEPQPWYGCPTPEKGRDVSSGRQSFYYLIIPSVVTEIPLWFPYFHSVGGWWEKGMCGEGRGYLQSREGTVA